jgi:hypothetical protein
MEQRVFGADLDLSGGAALTRDADALDRNRTQQWRGDFAEFDFQLLTMRLPAQPESESI